MPNAETGTLEFKNFQGEHTSIQVYSRIKKKHANYVFELAQGMNYFGRFWDFWTPLNYKSWPRHRVLHGTICNDDFKRKRNLFGMQSCL